MSQVFNNTKGTVRTMKNIELKISRTENIRQRKWYSWHRKFKGGYNKVVRMVGLSSLLPTGSLVARELCSVYGAFFFVFKRIVC